MRKVEYLLFWLILTGFEFSVVNACMKKKCLYGQCFSPRSHIDCIIVYTNVIHTVVLNFLRVE